MRVMAGDTDVDSLSGNVLVAMCDDVESICLQLCREMEEYFEQYPFMIRNIFFLFSKPTSA